MSATLSELKERIEAAGSVLVVSHDRPDGDAIGSALGMGLILMKLGKRVEIVNFDPVPESLSFLPGSDLVKRPAEKSRADLMIVLDSAGKDRVNAAVWEMADGIGTVINIDHHISNTEFGDLVHVDSRSPATGQIVYELARFAGWPLDAAIGENLLAAISTDTGSFRYPATTPATFHIAGELAALGINVGRLNRMLYENYPGRRVLALRILLQEMRLDFGGRCASVILPVAVSRSLDLQQGDTEGVIDVIRAIDTVMIAVLFEELPDGKVRVSSRSKEERFSVGAICAECSGGGHTLAAGARLGGPLDSAVERFLEAVGKSLDLPSIPLSERTEGEGNLEVAKSPGHA
ncbi:MAG TPA: bifunctional oligoribonuclease/PAP phosphatase NrnA [Verrucomicrobiales bacterium]|nr:bifunctional oligoribonuclease/PAP phosphatase NrnA [Verrucomicrobiales bacterium]